MSTLVQDIAKFLPQSPDVTKQVGSSKVLETLWNLAPHKTNFEKTIADLSQFCKSSESTKVTQAFVQATAQVTQVLASNVGRVTDSVKAVVDKAIEDAENLMATTGVSVLTEVAKDLRDKNTEFAKKAGGCGDGKNWWRECSTPLDANSTRDDLVRQANATIMQCAKDSLKVGCNELDWVHL